MERRRFFADDREYVRERNRGSNWLWLIPLLALPLLAWGAWRGYENNANNPTNQAYVLTSPEPSSTTSNNTSNNNGGLDNPATNNNTGMSANVTDDGRRIVTPGIGGGPDLTDTTPSGAPDTGLGGLSQ